MESDSWIIFLSIVMLIACSSFFAASETAMSTFNKIRMKKRADDGDKNAGLVMRIWDDYEKTISAILVGNNIVNIASSTLATVLATAFFGPAVGAVVATVAITVVVLVFGEVLPKSYAKDNADNFATKLAPPLNVAIRIVHPVSFLIGGIVKLLRGPDSGERAPSITEEELIYMMDAIGEEGVLEEQERELVRSALEFDEISLGEILTPRVNMVAADVEDGIDEIRRIIVEEGYSRIPVFEKSIDNIIGVLYTRDVLLAIISGQQFNIRDMLGEALFVHKGMKLAHLLTSFKSRKLNLAVVVDEYGGTLGMVTMEDVLEELVGDIWDEDDEIPSSFSQVGENSFEALGSLELPGFFERLGIDEDEADIDYATVGGWALWLLGHIPEVGESFTHAGYSFTILEMDGHRLRKLGITRIPDTAEESEAAEEKI